jgi:hypothetical protein
VEAEAVEPARTTTGSDSCRDDVSVSNASEMEVTEWVIQDEPGVYITVRELPDGARELRRVRFRSCISETSHNLQMTSLKLVIIFCVLKF